ncbi:uncharacterized protein LOC143175227 [Nomia melanderi]|uniref:uncharacterized protein LOC143175227 n=1 Tax=Nomia melanderi TaxID=2448451 RepID=UPI003FCD1BFB
MRNRNLTTTVISASIFPKKNQAIIIEAKEGLPTKEYLSSLGISEPGFAHILSFRRQIYVDSVYLEKIPESILLIFADTQCRIYFATETSVCFIYKQQGHLAKQCEFNRETCETKNIPDTFTDKTKVADNNNVSILDFPTIALSDEPVMHTDEIDKSTPCNKRPLSSSNPSSINNDNENSGTPENIKIPAREDALRMTSKRPAKKNKRSRSKGKDKPSFDAPLLPE